jgi:hypothetical protein
MRKTPAMRASEEAQITAGAGVGTDIALQLGSICDFDVDLGAQVVCPECAVSVANGALTLVDAHRRRRNSNGDAPAVARRSERLRVRAGPGGRPRGGVRLSACHGGSTGIEI